MGRPVRDNPHGACAYLDECRVRRMMADFAVALLQDVECLVAVYTGAGQRVMACCHFACLSKLDISNVPRILGTPTTEVVGRPVSACLGPSRPVLARLVPSGPVPHNVAAHLRELAFEHRALRVLAAAAGALG